MRLLYIDIDTLRPDHLGCNAEGGPYHVRGQLEGYLARLRATGRGDRADALARKYPKD